MTDKPEDVVQKQREIVNKLNPVRDWDTFDREFAKLVMMEAYLRDHIDFPNYKGMTT